MRKFSIYLLFASMAVASCKKTMQLDSLNFDAEASKTTLLAGDSAKFNFKGNPDVITFYSGEVGSRFDYRNRTSDTSSDVRLKFSTATTTATSGTLSLLVSNNYSGAFNAANIAAATWTDITSRALWATTTTTVASGTVSLTDFALQRAPIYIAFKYTATAATTQRKWTITGLTLDHVLTDKTYTIANMTANTPSPGWVAADVKNTAVNWTSALVITGATTTAAAVDTEDWIVAGPIDLSRVLPDVGTSVKNITEGMNKFPLAYRYTIPGIYNAVFVASNVNRDGQEIAMKGIRIIVQ